MTGYAPDEVDLYVPHQANKRILDGIAKRLGHRAREDRVHARQARQHVGGLDPAGAQSGVRGPRIKEGSLVLMEAMGGGFTWGAVLARW